MQQIDFLRGHTIMRTCLLSACLVMTAIAGYPQSGRLRLEAYAAAPGLFLEKLNSDSLVPPKRRNHQRLGDVASYGALVSMPLRNPRWLIKTGLGYSQRHYSLNKYGLDDFFIALFLFDSPPRNDTFAVSYVRLTNDYFQLPVALSWTLTRRGDDRGFRFTAGLNLRIDFLLQSRAELRLDSRAAFPSRDAIAALQQRYTAGATPTVFTLEPYIEHSFSVVKNLGMFWQIRPLSLLSSPLNRQYTSATVEFFSFTTGVFYQFRPVK